MCDRGVSGERGECEYGVCERGEATVRGESECERRV